MSNQVARDTPELLTAEQAFNTMVRYLEAYYSRTQADDIGALLGDLQRHEDGTTFDPAAWGDWLEAGSGAGVEATPTMRLPALGSSVLGGVRRRISAG